jgi:hypothetical protein
MGGWVLAMPKPATIGEMARILVAMSDLEEQRDLVGVEDKVMHDSGTDCGIPRSSTTPGSGECEICITPDSKNVLDEIGYFNDISPGAFVFDENKYSPPKRNLKPSEWKRTNRHLPIKIDPSVVNKPGERSPQALKQVVEYTQFRSPRYVAAPGERVSLCNIATWDWSRALQVHLPHWIGNTEMSANMLFRWISHPQAGGVYGEGWQPVKASAAQLLANRGVPVFALVEHPVPGRHGHVAMVYPDNTAFQADHTLVGITFATVINGRSRGGNGIKSLQDTFRRFTPTYFVHKNDFIVNQES